MIKRGGFLSGSLLGTFSKYDSNGFPPGLQATLVIEDLFEHEYQFPIVLLDHLSESDNFNEHWRCERQSGPQDTVMPPTEDKDEPM
jgi:hypothetical protein